MRLGVIKSGAGESKWDHALRPYYHARWVAGILFRIALFHCETLVMIEWM